MSLKWKVYLSSTYLDLKDKREELIAYFNKQLKGRFELTTIMERMYDDGSHTTFDLQCSKAVKDCDIYILIQGNSIGSFIPNSDITYTENELETAIQEKKEIFIFKLETFNKIEIGEKNIAKHNAILSKFENRDAHTFTDIDSIKLRFLESLSQYFDKQRVSVENPYKGLDAFNVTDGEYFFGRSTEIETCVNKIVLNKINNEKNFVSIIGNSGIGKTSFVQAGLLYHLKNHKDFKDYIQIITVPGNQPFSNLKIKLNDFDLSPELILDTHFSNKIILFINQFEEVISQCNSEESKIERQQLFDFFDAVKLKSSLSNILIIITFRSDFHSALANFDFIQNHQFIFPLSSLDYSKNSTNWEKSIAEIIKKPATINGVVIEDELVSKLQNELKEVDGSLPILQFTLSQIWNLKTIDDGKITSSEYNEISEGKGIEGIIEIHAEKVINRLIGNENTIKNEQILRSIFVNLVEVTDSLTDVKKTIKKKDLLDKLSFYPEQSVNTIYEDLIGENSRLLVETSFKDDNSNVDIIHEVLIRKWKRLKDWIDERREALEYQLKIKKDCNYDLYDRKELLVAQKWANGNPDLTDNEINEFVKKSKVRIKNNLLKLFGVSLFVILALSFFYIPILDKYYVYNLEKKEHKPISQIEYLVIDQNTDTTRLFNNISRFKNLKKIKIENLSNEKISFFNKIKNIETLEIIKNKNLKSLEGIKNLYNLRSLTIEGNDNLKNLDELKNSSKLKSLSIIGDFLLNKNIITNELETLKIGLLNSKEFYLKNINNLSHLKKLCITNLHVKDFEEVVNFKDLNYLSIEGDKKIDGIDGIEKLKRLDTLILSGIKKIKDINLINSIKSLKSLTISYSKNLITYPNLENINSLILSFKGSLISLNAIFKNENLNIKSLILFKNGELEGLDGIENLKNLTYLEINDNDMLNSLDGVSKLKNLKILKILNLGIGTDYYDLYNLKDIDTLYLSKELKIDEKRLKNNKIEIIKI